MFPLRLLIVCLTCSPSWTHMSKTTYLAERKDLMAQDLDQMTGSDLTLSPDEQIVNAFLMKYKNQEMQAGFTSLNFPPSINFLKSKSDIEKSEVFKILKQMPKGSALHTHGMASTSVAWVVSELTYWDDLYICNTTDNKYLLFKFFNTPDSSCVWKLVKNERSSYSSPETYDAYLRGKLSFYTNDVPDTYPDINHVWTAFEQVFTTISGLITYTEAWKAYLTRGLQEFMDDEILYVEFRAVLFPLYEKDGRKCTPVETVTVYRDAMQAFKTQNSRTFFDSRFIYSPHRLVDVNAVWNYVNLTIKLRNEFPTVVAGFDLVGQEDLGKPLLSFIDPLLFLANQDPPIPVFYHAGETNWEGLSTDENLFDAILLKTTRIGHGYALSKHPKLIEKARQADIAVEVCPISNQILMLVADMRNHPMTPLIAQSFPVVISSDDPAIWKALPLSHDFYEAFMGIGGAKADLKFLKKLALNSIKYTSLDNTQKRALEVQWQSEWDRFIATQKRAARRRREI